MSVVAGILEATANLDAIFGRFETVVNKFFERGDVAEDNKLFLTRIQRNYKTIRMQLPLCMSVVENDMHIHDSLCEMVNKLQEEMERVFSMEKDIRSEKRFNRLKSMNEILQNCEDLEDNLLQFLRENASTKAPLNSSPGNYTTASNVPPNPPRLTLVKERKSEERHIKWWDIAEDGNIHENVCHLLHCGNRIDELLWLLSRPEWIVYRLLHGGVLQVEADLDEGMAALEGSSSCGEQREHLEIIGKAVRLSRSYVYRNPREVWFQLYGRLQWHSTINEWTKKFVRRIERAAERPWVKAPEGVVQQASLQSQGIFESKGHILCIQTEKDIVRFVWASKNETEIGVTSWNTSTEDEKTVQMDMSYFEENAGDGYDAYDHLAAFSADGFHVTVADRLLHVCTLETETGKLETSCVLKTRSNTPKKKLVRRFFPSSLASRAERQEEWLIVAISKDGKYIATSNYRYEVQLWRAANGEKIGRVLCGHTDTVNCMTTSRDGTRAVTGSDDGTIGVWDVQSGKAIGGPLRGHTLGVYSLAMNADCSRVLSGAWDKSVRLWDILDGKPIGEPFVGLEDVVNCVSMSADGRKIVSGSWDGTVIVRDTEKGVMDGQLLRGHGDLIRHVEINGEEGIVVSASSDRTVRIWNTKRNEGVGERSDVIGNGHRRCLMSADGGRGVFKIGEDTAKVVDTQNGEAVGPPIRFDIESAECMAISADDKRGVFGMGDGSLIVFDATTGEKIGNPLCGHDEVVKCVAMSEDGNVIVSGSGDKTLRIWDSQSGESIGKPLAGRADWVTCVSLSSDRRRVVSGSDYGTVRVWDARSGEAIGQSFRDHTGLIWCVGLNVDSTKVVSGSEDGTVRVWDVQTSQQIAGPFEHNSSVYCLGFDVNISKIATICSDGVRKLWDVDSASCVLTSSGHQWNSQVNRLRLSWNGRFDWARRKKIIDVDENGTETVLASTDVEVFNGPCSDVYFSESSDALEVVR